MLAVDPARANGLGISSKLSLLIILILSSTGYDFFSSEFFLSLVLDSLSVGIVSRIGII